MAVSYVKDGLLLYKFSDFGFIVADGRFIL